MFKKIRLILCVILCVCSSVKSWCALTVPGNYKTWEICPTRVVGLIPVKDTTERKFCRISEVDSGVQVDEVNSCGHVTETVIITFVKGTFSYIEYKNQWQRTYQTVLYTPIGADRYFVTGRQNGVNMYTPANGVINTYRDGLCVQVDYVSSDLKPVENNYGFATVKYDRFSDARRFGLVKSSRVFDVQGRPMVSGYEECFRSDFERDVTGNLVSVKHFDTSGQLLENKFGVAITDYIYDANDNIAEISYRNGMAENTKNSLGAYRALFHYQKGLMADKVLLGKDGTLLRSSDCSSNFTQVRYSYNFFGSPTEETTLNENGRLVKSMSGFAKTVSVYNEANMLIEKSVFDTSSAPTVDKGNVHKWRYMYDIKGQKVLSASYDTLGAPCKDPDDRAYVRQYYYNYLGQCTETSFWYADGKTAMDRWDGYHINKTKYNEAGLPEERSYFGKDGRVAILTTGASREVFAYNSSGQLTERAYYNGTIPVMVQTSSTATATNFHSIHYAYNGNSKTSSVEYFDTLGQPVNARVSLKEKVECHRIEFYYRGSALQMENLYKIGIVDPIKMIDCKHERYITITGVGWEHPQGSK